jgi:hypothetical protein
MAQLFHPSSNTIAKVSIFGAVFFLAGLAWMSLALNRSPYMTKTGVAREQPVPFSHKHHVQGVGIDCRYCHTSVEESAFAGIPPTKLCMNCHSVLWKDAPVLEPVRESYRTNESIQWTRVHDLPDFVYFDHSIHVAKGVACVTCHGQVDEMPLMWQENSLHMEWCLNCHRHPEKYIGPKDQVTSVNIESHESQETVGKALVEEYKVQTDQLDNCSICHR